MAKRGATAMFSRDAESAERTAPLRVAAKRDYSAFVERTHRLIPPRSLSHAAYRVDPGGLIASRRRCRRGAFAARSRRQDETAAGVQRAGGRGRADDPPAGEHQLRRPRPHVGAAILAIPELRRPQTGEAG